MKNIFLPFIFLCLAIVNNAEAQTIYTFSGNGNWSNASNWGNNAIPPASLIAGTVIFIDPVIDGECIVDVPVHLPANVNIFVKPNKKIRVPGALAIQVEPPVPDGVYTDPRDGQQYGYRQIGSQVWMTKNMNYYASGALCYDMNSANCDTYGRLYTWDDAFYAVPPGWHLPSDAEWTTLTTFLGGEDIAGGALKDTILWSSPNEGATNSSGFKALPAGGSKTEYPHEFFSISTRTDWWTSTANDIYGAWFRELNYDSRQVIRRYQWKLAGYSVRCIKN
jgi:uncharacterized protein (TIGR02145 family)